MNAIGIDRKVSSLRDLEGNASVVVRRLKPTVNKVLSLRDILGLSHKHVFERNYKFRLTLPDCITCDYVRLNLQFSRDLRLMIQPHIPV